jgi:hypothetical protein
MTLALRPITNRAADGRFRLPADGWWHLVPIGEYPHPESKLSQVLDREALQEIVNRFTPGTLVDFDHFSYDPTHSSEAAGWIDRVELREDGIWAKARWSDVGEAALVNGRYRFVSPVWMPRDVVRLDGNRVRPTRLDSAGLTNQPNLRGMAPIVNRMASTDDPDGAANPKPRTQTQSMKSVASRLGLQADASEDAIRTAVDAVITERDTLKAEVGPMKNRLAESETEAKRLREVQATTDLEPYKDQIPEAARGHWREQLMLNREATLATLATLKPSGGAPAGGTKVLANRGTPGAEAQSDAKDPAAAFLQRVNEYKLANRCTYDAAFNAVRSAEPKLFAATQTRPESN